MHNPKILSMVNTGVMHSIEVLGSSSYNICTGVMHSLEILYIIKVCSGLDFTQTKLTHVYCLCWTLHSHKNTIYSWISHSFRASHSHLEMVVVQSQDAKLVLCSFSCSGDSLYSTGHMIYQTGTNISKHIQIRPFQLSHDKV